MGSKKDKDLTCLTLQCILNLDDAFTAVIPGLSTAYQVQNAARASCTRQRSQTAAEKQRLARVMDE